MRHWLAIAAAGLAPFCGTPGQAQQMTEFVAVRGIAPGEQVSLRSGPSTGNGIIAWADQGETLRNIGCTRATPSWCQLQVLSGEAAGQTGWLADRYLGPSAPPAAARFGRAEPRYAAPPPAPPPPAAGRAPGDDSFPGAQIGVTYNTKCGAVSNNCLDDARLYCRGDYHVLDSESHYGAPGDDSRAGTMMWYSMNFRCGPGPGVYPNFPRRG
jgi:hypothetical protein